MSSNTARTRSRFTGTPFESGQRVLVVDDLLATGGTVLATVDLVRQLGGQVAGAAFLIELEGPGRASAARLRPNHQPADLLSSTERLYSSAISFHRGTSVQRDILALVNLSAREAFLCRNGEMRTIYRDGKTVKLIDQTRLPQEVSIVECATAASLCDAIRTMRIRGAPALGVAAVYAMALGAEEAPDRIEPFLSHVESVADLIRATRPTAVNLFWGVGQGLAAAREGAYEGVDDARGRLWNLADRLADEDVRLNVRLGAHGAELIPDGARVLTHCNAGALATSIGAPRSVCCARRTARVSVYTCSSTRLVPSCRAPASPRGSSSRSGSRTR
jgi:hypothetical protein